jgi:hypothetical protein
MIATRATLPCLPRCAQAGSNRALSLGRMCSYRLEAGTDLLGAWLVDLVYGRIGTRGRRIRYVLWDKDEARKLVWRSLRRRATARKRVGVSYRFRELIDPNDWCPSIFEQITSN